MRSETALAALAITLALHLTGCKKPTPAASNPVVYTHADILMPRDTSGQQANRRVRIQDAAQLQTLVGFFPDLGSGKRSPQAGGWTPLVKITFFKADGTAVTVQADDQWWTEGIGNGDWPVPPAFAPWITGVFSHTTTRPTDR